MLTQEKLDSRLRRPLDEYLKRVAEALTRSKRAAAEIQSICEDIEIQFYILLKQRAGESPTEDDVYAVLADFDEPQAYDHEQVIKPAPRFSRVAILAACWAPFFLGCVGLLLFWPNLPIPPGFASFLQEFGLTEPTSSYFYMTHSAWWKDLIVYTILSIGAAAPFGTTILGWIAFTQIHKSEGRLIGMGLAFANAVFYPALLLNVLICVFLGWAADYLAAIFTHDLPFSRVFALTFLMIGLTAMCLADFFITKRAWKTLARSTA